jgi:hypothetical protein
MHILENLTPGLLYKLTLPESRTFEENLVIRYRYWNIEHPQLFAGQRQFLLELMKVVERAQPLYAVLIFKPIDP